MLGSPRSRSQRDIVEVATPRRSASSPCVPHPLCVLWSRSHWPSVRIWQTCEVLGNNTQLSQARSAFAFFAEYRHDAAVVDDDLGGFGERVRTARERLRLSQHTLGVAVGADAGTVSRWERGRGYPQTQQLARLAHALGESLDYLVLGVPGKHAPVAMPRAFLDFLLTEHGRIAQERAYLPTLLSVRPNGEPTVRFYQAIVAGLLLGDDD